MPPTNDDRPEQFILAQFERRGADAGDEIRITAGNQSGYHYCDLRYWFKSRDRDRAGPTGDGWFPSKVGVRLRETDIDLAIKALEDVRAAVHADGRSTSGEPPRRVDRPSSPAPARRSGPEVPLRAGSPRPPARPPATATNGGDEGDIPF